MAVDIICVVLLVMAIFKGYSKGLVVALFSVAGFVVGIAAAMKLSALVAVWMGEGSGVSSRWWPALSFLAVFVAVVLAVRLGARLIEKTLQLALLGWANRLAGILLYMALYMMVASVLFFYAAQIHLIGSGTLLESAFWPIIEPMAPWVMRGVGKLLPWFMDVFDVLKNFFSNMAEKSQ